MLLNVELTTWKLDLEALDWERFSAVWPLAQEEKPDHAYNINIGPCRLTTSEIQELTDLGVKLELQPLPHAMLVKMRDKREWSYGEDIQPRDLQDGTAVQITIPDLALMNITEVTWREDCCTEELQEMLDKGWRLLAVCPPNAQRRPDYILGRRKTKED